ncbi:MAG: hypothetical protein M3451_10555 [Chloroflexota bacterium]|nr:hypothetical protein [Acidobacteriota bacterium]MDQ3525476.1 hypothetical protein [Chloroflexota bacterium]
MTADERLISKRFPRASAYDPEWIIAGASGGANTLWLTEWLADALELRPTHASIGPRLRAGDVLSLPTPGVRRAGLGDRPVVQP